MGYVEDNTNCSPLWLLQTFNPSCVIWSGECVLSYINSLARLQKHRRHELDLYVRQGTRSDPISMPYLPSCP